VSAYLMGLARMQDNFYEGVVAEALLNGVLGYNFNPARRWRGGYFYLIFLMFLLL